jgi:hypothetical protein
MLPSSYWYNIYVEFKRYSWSAHIRLWGAESWGNINQLRDRYVDVFGYWTKRLYGLSEDDAAGVTPPVNVSRYTHHNWLVSSSFKPNTST